MRSSAALAGQYRKFFMASVAVPFASAEPLAEAVAGSVASFASGREQFDGMTVLALHREAVLEGALPVSMDSLEVLRDEIMGKAPDRAFGLRVCLACEEAFANIVMYSGAQGIWTSVEAEQDGLRVILEDDGIPFDPLAHEADDKPFEELDEGGMGIGLIRNVTREVSYRRAGDRNVLDMLF